MIGDGVLLSATQSKKLQPRTSSSLPQRVFNWQMHQPKLSPITSQMFTCTAKTN